MGASGKAKNATKKQVKKEKKQILELSRQVTRLENAKSPNKGLRNQMARAVISENRDPRINWYLVTLLDPSRWEEALAHGVRGIPDFYSHRNHIFCTRTVEDLDSNNFDSEGKCFIKCTPSMSDHLHHTGNNGVATAFKYSSLGSDAHSNVVLDFIDNNNRAQPLPTGVVNNAAVLNNGELQFPTDGNLECVFGATGCKTLMAYNAALVSGSYSYSFAYKMTPNAANAVTIALSWFSGLAGAGTFDIQVVTDLATRTATHVTAANDTSARLQFTLNALDAEIRSIKFINKSGQTIVLKGITATITVYTPSSFTSLTSHPVQNYERIAADFQSVRPIGGYLWVKYRGGLTSNGSLAGALIDSTQNPVVTDAMSYEQIAGLLHAHEGSVVNGGYGIWCPMNPRDTDFASPSDDRVHSPYIVCGLDVNDPLAQSVRVDCYWVWEGLTQQQMYAPEPGTVDIAMMNDAFAKLSHFDKFMENDLHLKAIGHFLGNSFKKGADLVRQYASSPSGRAALMSAGQALLSKASQYGPTVANAARMAMNALQTLA